MIYVELALYAQLAVKRLPLGRQFAGNIRDTLLLKMFVRERQNLHGDRTKFHMNMTEASLSYVKPALMFFFSVCDALDASIRQLRMCGLIYFYFILLEREIPIGLKQIV